MASTRERHTKDGRRYYEIIVSRGRGKSYLTSRWYVPEGWSERVVQRELSKVSAEFERQVKEGNVLSHAEQRKIDEERAAAEAAEQAKKQTVEAFSKTFLKRVALERSENTRQNYECLINKHVIPAFGKLLVQDVTSAEIDALMTDMLAKGYKLSTRQRTWTVLNLLFKAAKRQRLIRYSPMDDLDGERPTATKAEKAAAERKKDSFLDANEVGSLLEAIDGEDLKWRCYVYLLALTGVRRGEACGLEWKDIDFANQEIRVSKSLNYTAKKGVYVSDTKSGKTRIISLKSDDPGATEIYTKFFQMLKDLKKDQQKNKVVTLNAEKARNWVFRQDSSTDPMHPTSPTRFFKVFGDRYGIENFHPHLLRHSFVSIAIAEGQDVVAVSRTAGHADARITLQVYAHANTESVRKVTGAVGHAISQPGKQDDTAFGDK